jgi:hypothetical protein
MTKTITITCDECQKELELHYMPIILSATLFDLKYEMHFCDYSCLKTYLLTKFKDNEQLI